MEDSESTSYCPDFSDVYAASVVHNEDYSFWDFLKNDEEECSTTLKQDNSKTGVCFVDHSDNLSTISMKIKYSSNKLKNVSYTEKIVKNLDLCASNTVGCHIKDEKKVNNNNEEEFWDFLKSDLSTDNVKASLNQAILSTAEFNELNSLSSISPLSINNTTAACNTEISNIVHSNNKTEESTDDFWDFLKSEPLSLNNNTAACNIEISNIVLSNNKTEESTDDFWDFLKSDDSSNQVDDSTELPILTQAELVERNILFSASPSSLNDKSSASQISSVLYPRINSLYCDKEFSNFNHPKEEKSSHWHTTDKCSPSKEIRRDLCQTISGIDLDPGISESVIEKNVLNKQLQSTKVICTNSTANKVRDNASNSTTMKNVDKITFHYHKPLNTDSPFLTLKKRKSEGLKNKTKVPQNTEMNLQTSCNYQAIKKKKVNAESQMNSVLPTGSYFPQGDYELNHKAPVSCNSSVKTDAKVVLQTIPEQSNSMKISRVKKSESTFKETVTDLITVSSCPIVNHQQNETVEKLRIENTKNIKENFTQKTFEFAPSDQKSLFDPTHSSSLSLHDTLEANFKVDSFNENILCQQIPKVQPHVLQNSPKNSVFKITDSQPTINNIQPFTNTVIAEVNCKKQKVISNVYPQEICNSENDQKVYPTVPLKCVVLPTSTVTNSETPVNPLPLYLIIPDNPQTGSNQNAELVMLIGNNSLNTNLKINESTPSTTYTGLTPVTWSSRSFDNQPSYSVFHAAGIQNLNASIPNVMTLQRNPTTSKATDSLRYTVKTDPLTKPVFINSNKTQTLVNSTLINSHILPKNCVNVNRRSIFTTSSLNVNTNTVPIASHLPIPTLMNNIQFESTAPQKDQTSNKVRKYNQSINFIPSLPKELVEIQSLKQIRPLSLKPLKSISLGRDKNAIQQISVPVKIDSITNLNVLSSENKQSSLPNSPSCSILQTETIQNKIDGIIKTLDEQLVTGKQQINCLNYRNGLFSSAQKRNSDRVVVKKNLITSNIEVLNSNRPLQYYQSCTQPTVISSLNESTVSNVEYSDKKLDHSVVSLNENNSVNSITSTDILKSTRNFKASSADIIFPNVVNTVKIESVCSLSQIPPNKSTNNAIATLQELFPPPITMIPVSVTTTLPSMNKASSQVLVLQNSSSLSNGPIIKKSQHETELKKTAATKSKKLGRKTVRQLLEERYQHTNINKPSNNAFQPRVQTKVLRPIYKLAGNGTLLPVTVTGGVQRSLDSINYSTKANPISAATFKRPNIMMLPSAAKILKGNNYTQNKYEKSFESKGSLNAGDTYFKTLDIPKDSLINKMSSKDYKPRYYDMSELCIGYFKVVDDAETCGRYRSKFKVIFTKRQFLYEFPISKCNQVDISTFYSSDQVVRIQVSFQSLVAMRARNRQIDIQIKECPQHCLKKSEERSSISMKDSSKDNNFLTSALQNSLYHKITLRRRQADYLKNCLCQFDPSFNLLFNFGEDISKVVSSFKGELGTANLRKVYLQNKKNVIRRLPQWDAEDAMDPDELKKDQPSLPQNQTCSCRISCKSLRCSCVKAVKSCSSGGTACLCTNCDNPLNILDSFGINLDFSLNDCCLFQNIYRIPKLRPFLLRCVKLSCCNTVARVVDCIPGTILCPNIECNESLEFSWCQGIICYPERNPRNHCSFCGLCCYSNKRHCPICNRCYTVTPKCLDCPNCRGTGFVLKSIDQEYMEESCLQSMKNIKFHGETPSLKPSSKPKIIVLDGVLSANPISNCKETEDEINSEKDMLPSTESSEMLKQEFVRCAEKAIKEQNVESKAEVKNEQDVKLEDDILLKQTKVKSDDCKDFILKEEETKSDIYLEYKKGKMASQPIEILIAPGQATKCPLRLQGCEGRITSTVEDYGKR